MRLLGARTDRENNAEMLKSRIVVALLTACLGLAGSNGQTTPSTVLLVLSKSDRTVSIVDLLENRSLAPIGLGALRGARRTRLGRQALTRHQWRTKESRPTKKVESRRAAPCARRGPVHPALGYFPLAWIRSTRLFTMPSSAQPGFRREPSTWKVYAPKAASLGT